MEATVNNDPNVNKDHRVRGLHHAAFPTSEPAATLRFYRDTLGFPLVHTISAVGWGPADQPDMVHFFFDIGGDEALAFFYYFGKGPYRDPGCHDLPDLSRHIAIRVDSAGDLDEYQRRLEEGGHPISMRVRHETVESIYVEDPNGYHLELARSTRPLGEIDHWDAELTMQALVDVSEDPEPTLGALRRRKAELAAPYAGGSHHDRLQLFITRTAEFEPLVRAIAETSGVTVEEAGPYVALSSPTPIVVDRRATGVNQAIWYSALAGLHGARVVQHDRDTLRIEPDDA